MFTRKPTVSSFVFNLDPALGSKTFPLFNLKASPSAPVLIRISGASALLSNLLDIPPHLTGAGNPTCYLLAYGERWVALDGVFDGGNAIDGQGGATASVMATRDVSVGFEYSADLSNPCALGLVLELFELSE